MEVSTRTYKTPISVLVVVHTPELEVLLLERADRPGFWQSVTGSQDAGETLVQTALRELAEETGIDGALYELTDWGIQNRYEIYPQWRYRYAPGITHNIEHVFSVQVPRASPMVLNPREHLAYVWLPWQAAAGRAFSWSNVEAIRRLPQRISGSNTRTKQN
ncbi:MAG TPA: dihydroneopterin triphosphate diphosphatase [Burkholderiales bacterium]|nr:dihydroneopterin triphosphate diphosphatase [Burkholderiales bacterium]